MKAQTLQDKLARSLDQANAKAAKATRATGPRRQPPLALALAEKHCSKLSVSLFDNDLKRVEAIRAHVLAATGKAISTSQAIKLALRTAPLSPELFKALDQVRAEDGRKW